MSTQAANAAGLLSFFSARFDYKAATTDELEFLSSADEHAECNAISLSEVVSGVASLICADSDTARSGIRSGALQDGSVTDLLFHVADAMATIGKLSYIAGEANYQLILRAKGGAK